MQENVDVEVEAWRWLENHEHQIPGYKELFDLSEKLKRERQKKSPSEDKLERIIDDFHRLVETKGIILSTSTTGRFVNNIEDREVALSSLKTFMGGIDKALEGALIAFLFKKGLRKKLLPEKQAYLDLLTEIRAGSRKQLDELSERERELTNRCRDSEQLVISLDSRIKTAIEEAESQKDTFIDKVNGEIELKLNDAGTQIQDQIDELRDKLSEETSSARDRITNFVEAYKSEMQLQAPVSYWEENKTFHRVRAKYFGMASLAISPLIFALITWIGWEVLSSEKVLWGKVGVVVFATSLAVWLIRILVRMYLSHNHLELSSQERIIMTKSYLALLSEGGASSPEERQLVLQSIFRPAATGIINDDAAPPSVIELINRMPSTKK
ncbi:DUF6161 domain-containing protein [Marinomonas gallaica]|uniref:DUF6161 domain-containing protein n=1 Tax=Marinomonas gallaica TaxID=1806667 RepID=UPI003A94E8C7